VQLVEPPKRVLLVDDDRQQFLLIGYQLSAAHYDNYRLVWCQDLEKGLIHIENQECDVVLLDYHWGVNCTDFIRRANVLNSRIPVIVMTDDRESDVDRRAISEGASDYLVKENVNSEVLERSIRYAIERKKIEQHLDHLAHYDHLTGLPNRVLFLDRLEQMVSLSQRSKHQFTLMYIDLNKFKEINDNHGHHTGDKLLAEFSARLQAAVRRSDTVARIGGDEFTVILNNVGSTPEIIFLAQKIIDSIEQPFFIAENALQVGCSIGIAVFPDAGSTVDLLQRNADTAMYQAKETGTSSYRFFLKKKKANTLIENISCDELREQIENKKITLRYTPRIDLETKRVIGVIVAPIWNHKELGKQSHQTFASIIENTETIKYLTEWMIEASVKELHSLRQIHAFALVYAIRRPQLQSSRFGCYVKDIMAKNSVAMGSVEFTFLKKHGCNKEVYLKECIENVIDMGAKISLPNFGENTFGLANMHNYDVPFLHFGSSFITSALKNKKDMLLLETLVLLAHRLDRKVVLDNVLAQSDVDILRSVGCDCAQGGAFGEELTEKKLTAFLKKTTPPLFASND
jgi:diguanylate cyclase (GGDEF)-like protein